MRVLVTGGAGYIGSHTAVALAAAGHEPVLFDNLSNARERTLGAVRRLAGRRVRFVEGDVRDADSLDAVLDGGAFGGVVHLAARKARAGAEDALACHENNVEGTATLAARMAVHGVRALVAASSAAVYGAASTRLGEDSPTRPAGPYGLTKLGAERVLEKAQRTDPGRRTVVLRYFNAAGAHPDGRLGEDPPRAPEGLVPRLARVALGLEAELEVYGGSWPTVDGTCVRDYVHVFDVARANVAAVEAAGRAGGGGLWTCNVGTGQGHTVLETLRAFEAASGRRIRYGVVARRGSDVAMACADPTGTARVLGWRSKADLPRICADAWRWQARACRQEAAAG